MNRDEATADFRRMDKNSGTLNVLRGLTGAVLCALAAVAVAAATLRVIAVFRWYAWGANDADWRYDMSFVTDAMPSVIPGFAVVFGAAGWATYAPRGSFRLARTLSIIFVASLPLWFLIWYAVEWIGLAPRQLKEDHTRVELAGLLVLLAAPILTAAVLTAIRIVNVKQRVTGKSPPDAEPSRAL